MIDSERNVPRNCWEFMKCPTKVKGKCPAYKNNAGIVCWFFLTAKGGYPTVRNGDSCINCPWFKRNNPNSIEEIFDSKNTKIGIGD
jgi:hypothetical protein